MKYTACIETTVHEYHEVEARSPEEALEFFRTGKSTVTDAQKTSNIGDVEQVL